MKTGDKVIILNNDANTPDTWWTIMKIEGEKAYLSFGELTCQKLIIEIRRTNPYPGEVCYPRINKAITPRFWELLPYAGYKEYRLEPNTPLTLLQTEENGNTWVSANIEGKTVRLNCHWFVITTIPPTTLTNVPAPQSSNNKLTAPPDLSFPDFKQNKSNSSRLVEATPIKLKGDNLKSEQLSLF